jgi:hypothetical protein
MISRRAFTAGLTVGSLLPGVALAETEAPTALKIYLEERQVGEFGIVLTRSGDELRAEVDIDIKLRGFVGIPLYSYNLSSKEIWKSGQLQSLASDVRKGQKTQRIEVGRLGERLLISSEKFNGEAPKDVGTSSYFSKDLLDRKTWINTDNGKLITIEANRERRVEIAGQEFVEFSTTGGLETRVFYTDDGRFGGAIFDVKGRQAQILPGHVSAVPAKLG